MIFKQLLVLALTLNTVFIQAQPLTSEDSGVSANFVRQNWQLLVLLGVLVLLAIGAYLDRRNGSRYMGALRRKLQQLIGKLQAMWQRKAQKKEKVSPEDNIATSKEMHTNIFDSQKTYVQADISSIQEAVILEKKLEAASSLELEEESPKVDLREVFGQKDGQSNKRSKSKIRNRVQIKKSERESEDSQETKESKQSNSFEIGATEE